MDNKEVIVEMNGEKAHFSYYEYKNYDSAKNKFKKHMHYKYEMLFIRNGNLDYTIEDTTYLLKKGDLLLIKPNKYHFVKAITTAPYCRFCMIFPKKLVEEQLLNDVYNNAEIIHLENGSDTEKLFDVFYDSLSDDNQEALKMLYNCFLQLILYNIKKSFQSQKPLHEFQYKHDNNLISYINKNFITINKIEDISKAIFVSPSFINHYFKKNLDISCMKFVQQKKIFHARNLIESGRKPTDVYLECGFSNYVTFYRQYISIFGHSPHKTI